MMDRKKMTLVGLVLCVISLVLQLIGYVSPGWVVMVIYLHVIGAVLGLGITGFGELTTTVSVWYGTVCMESDSDTGSCTTRADHDDRFYGLRVTTALSALADIEWTRIQVLLTLALVLCCVGIVLAFLAVRDKLPLSPRILTAIAAASMAVSGILVLPAACEVIIAIANAKAAVSRQTELTGYKLVQISVPWAIILILLGVIVAFVATVVLILATTIEERPKILGISSDSSQELYDLKASLDREASVISIPPRIGAPDKEPLVFGGKFGTWGEREGSTTPAPGSPGKIRRFFFKRASTASSVIIGPPNRKQSETSEQSLQSGRKSSGTPSVQTDMTRSSTGSVSLSKIPLVENEHPQDEIKTKPKGQTRETKPDKKKEIKQEEKSQTKQGKVDTKSIFNTDDKHYEAWNNTKQDNKSHSKQNKNDKKQDTEKLKETKWGIKPDAKPEKVDHKQKTETLKETKWVITPDEKHEKVDNKQKTETLKETKWVIQPDAKQEKVDNKQESKIIEKQNTASDSKQYGKKTDTKTDGNIDTKPQPKHQNTKVVTKPEIKTNSRAESKQGAKENIPARDTIGQNQKTSATGTDKGEKKVINNYFGYMTTEDVSATRPQPRTSKHAETPRDKKAATMAGKPNGIKQEKNKVESSPRTPTLKNKINPDMSQIPTKKASTHQTKPEKVHSVRNDDTPTTKPTVHETDKKSGTTTIEKKPNDESAKTPTRHTDKDTTTKTAAPEKDKADKSAAVIVVSPYGNDSHVPKKVHGKPAKNKNMTDENEQKFYDMSLIYKQKLTHEKDKHGRLMKKPQGSQLGMPIQLPREGTAEHM